MFIGVIIKFKYFVILKMYNNNNLNINNLSKYWSQAQHLSFIIILFVLSKIVLIRKLLTFTEIIIMFKLIYSF